MDSWDGLDRSRLPARHLEEACFQNGRDSVGIHGRWGISLEDGEAEAYSNMRCRDQKGAHLVPPKWDAARAGLTRNQATRLVHRNTACSRDDKKKQAHLAPG